MCFYVDNLAASARLREICFKRRILPQIGANIETAAPRHRQFDGSGMRVDRNLTGQFCEFHLHVAAMCSELQRTRQPMNSNRTRVRVDIESALQIGDLGLRTMIANRQLAGPWHLNRIANFGIVALVVIAAPAELRILRPNVNRIR